MLACRLGGRWRLGAVAWMAQTLSLVRKKALRGGFSGRWWLPATGRVPRALPTLHCSPCRRLLWRIGATVCGIVSVAAESGFDG